MPVESVAGEQVPDEHGGGGPAAGGRVSVDGTSADVAVAAFAGPDLPTAVTVPSVADSVPDGLPRVRWCRRPETADDDAGPDGSLDAGPDSGLDSRSDGIAGEPRLADDAPPGWSPKAGAVAAVAGDPPSWLVGVGEGSAKDWRAAGAAAVKAARDAPVGGGSGSSGSGSSGSGSSGSGVAAGDGTPPAVVLVPEHSSDLPDDAEGWRALVTGVVLGSHRFAVREQPAAPPVVHLAVPAEHRVAVGRAVELARATALARDLADTPSGVKSPDWFARTATDLVAGSGLRVTVHDEGWLAEERFGGVLAVGGGSSRPPRLLRLDWDPPGASATVVLVGKGITFDTGGISIKPNAGMADMRTDCAGGAAVVAAAAAVARLGLPVRVTGLVPLAENHVSGSSYRPGDVVRHRGGTTTEVTNTDAEGRMVLADALAYAVETLAPDVVVDVATLTGAMKVALGVRTGGVFATSPDLANELVAAGAGVGESWWPMPLTHHLDEGVASDIADVRQAPTGPGAIVAALFLRRFTGGVPWAHLDIAGPARCDAPHEEVGKGATGFAARTLVEFCTSRL